MTCYIHQEREAVAICTACGKFICKECHVSVDNKATCVNCIKKELESKPIVKKSSLLTFLFSFFFIFPLGLNYLYIGHSKKALFFVTVHLVMFLGYIFLNTQPIMPLLFIGLYYLLISLLRIATFMHCLTIIKGKLSFKLSALLLSLFILVFFSRSLFNNAFTPLMPFTEYFFVYPSIPIFTLITPIFFLISCLIFCISFISSIKKKKQLLNQPLLITEEPLTQINDENTESIKALMEYSNTLKSYAYNFREAKIHSQIQELYEVTNKITKFLQKYPHKISSLSTFLEYYLPTTIKLLDNYKHLKAQGNLGTNIKKATTKIEDLLNILQKAFNNQLDMLFEDKAIDIDAEVNVLKTILEKEGLL